MIYRGTRTAMRQTGEWDSAVANRYVFLKRERISSRFHGVKVVPLGKGLLGRESIVSHRVVARQRKGHGYYI